MGRPKQHKRTVRVSVSLTEADYQRLTDLAKSNDISVAWIIRKAVTEYLAVKGVK